MIETLDQLLNAAKSKKPAIVSVANAEDEAALDAILQAGKIGMAKGLLFGQKQKIENLIENLGEKTPDYVEIRDIPDQQQAVLESVKAVRNGEASILLKGKIKTSALLKVVLDAEFGLRTGRLLSDVFLFEDPQRPQKNKLMMITDGGVSLAPDINQKVDIIKNAVEVCHAMGNECPKVALLSAVETVVPALQSTVDAAIITKMNERGQIKGCIIDGPLALDNAVSVEAAKIKGIDSPVAGKADVLVCPGIEAANMLAKGTTYFARFRLAHVIMGSAAPVLIPSRSDTADAKLLSIAMGKLVCELAQ